MIEPFLLRPVLQEKMWGGYKLSEIYGKYNGGKAVGESWEVSVHPNGESVIDSGIYNGIKLSKLINDNPDVLGKDNDGNINLLIKFIDAAENLSVQVHPDDEWAYKMENGQKGKSEAWYILSAEPESVIYVGFKEDVDRNAVEKAINEERIVEYLNEVHPAPGELYYIPAGTVHAIGAGVTLVEIQESSDLTYRLYDYGRCDINGKKRELHCDKGLTVMNYDSMSPECRKAEDNAVFTELLINEQFSVYEINTNKDIDTVNLNLNKEGFCIIVCIEGEFKIGKGNPLTLNKGSSAFIPSGIDSLTLQGGGKILYIHNFFYS